MKIERKITFVVAGIEFDNLKTAQFFQRAIRLYKLEEETPEACTTFLIDHWNGLLFGRKPPMGFTTQQVVALVHNLQMPKPARKAPTPKKKNVQALAGDPHTKEFWYEHHTKNQFLEPTLDEQEEVFRAGLTD